MATKRKSTSGTPDSPNTDIPGKGEARKPRSGRRSTKSDVPVQTTAAPPVQPVAAPGDVPARPVPETPSATLSGVRPTYPKITAERRTPTAPSAEPHQPAISGECISEQERIALLAYSFWEARGRQGGSPEEDWYRAERDIRRMKRTGGDELTR